MGTSGRVAVRDDERREPNVAPQALLHRKVLDVAAANPSVTTERIASEVDEASPSFVERVFAEYGDPAEGDRSSGAADGRESTPGAAKGNSTGRDCERESAPAPASAPAPESDVDLAFDPRELSTAQVETLRVVHENPTATQRAVAERLDRDRSTVAKRINEIPGFEWASRRDLVETLFEDGELRLDSGPIPATETAATVTDGAGPDAADGRTGAGGSVDPTAGAGDVNPATGTNPEVDPAGEAQAGGDAGVEDDANLDATVHVNTNGQPELSNDPELVHKVAHACLDAEYITTDEELRILRGLLVGSG
jgi:hypothetical protein